MSDLIQDPAPRQFKHVPDMPSLRQPVKLRDGLQIMGIARLLVFMDSCCSLHQGLFSVGPDLTGSRMVKVVAATGFRCSLKPTPADVAIKSSLVWRSEGGRYTSKPWIYRIFGHILMGCGPNGPLVFSPDTGPWKPRQGTEFKFAKIAGDVGCVSIMMWTTPVQAASLRVAGRSL